MSEQVQRHEPVVLTEPLMTTEEAAALLAVRESWLREAVRGRRVPHVKVGKHVRFIRSELEDWLSEQRVEAVGA